MILSILRIISHQHSSDEWQSWKENFFLEKRRNNSKISQNISFFLGKLITANIRKCFPKILSWWILQYFSFHARFYIFYQNILRKMRHQHKDFYLWQNIHTLKSSNASFSNRTFCVLFYWRMGNCFVERFLEDGHLFSHNARRCVKNPIKLKYFWSVWNFSGNGFVSECT